MTFHASVNTTHLYSYEALYNGYEPKKVDSLEHRVHKDVGRLINVQFKTVKRFEDIAIISRKVDDLIRELKAEFGCISINLNEHEYPHFIRKLEGYGVYPELADYHYYIIELLKLMLFRIGHSDDKREIENQIKGFLIVLVEQYDPPKKMKPSFKDKKPFKKMADSSVVTNAENNVTKIFKGLVDIEIDK